VDDSVRVCMNGMVRGGLINGAERCESRAFTESAIDIEDLLRLCREVKLSSSGFRSGGSLAIL
jgi:hypothetical protein